MLQNIEDSAVSADGLTVADLLRNLSRDVKDLKTGQQTLVETITAEVQGMKNQISDLRSDLSKMTVSLSSDISELDRRLASVEKKGFDGAVATKGVNSPDLTVVAYGVNQSSTESAFETATSLINELGQYTVSRVKIIDALRMNNKYSEKPGLLKIAFENLEQKKVVLAAKASLKLSRQYSSVYIRLANPTGNASWSRT